MKRKWVPAALMGCIGLGYLAGSVGSDRRENRLPETSAASAPAAPPASTAEAPRVIVPIPAPDDGLGEYPAWNGVDLDCSDIGHPVRVTGADPHRLDGDGNGVGCESQ